MKSGWLSRREARCLSRSVIVPDCGRGRPKVHPVVLSSLPKQPMNRFPLFLLLIITSPEPHLGQGTASLPSVGIPVTVTCDALLAETFFTNRGERLMKETAKTDATRYFLLLASCNSPLDRHYT
jgi:hypothetical protein